MAELRGSIHIDLDYPLRISHIAYQISDIKTFFFTFFACPKKVTKKGHPRTRFSPRCSGLKLRPGGKCFAFI